MTSQKLYHGTSAKFLPQIQREGILPRAKSKGKDNWKHTVSSNKDAVYLTTAYPWHFAAAASEEKVGLILEIDRDALLPWLLAPDEDFLEQGSRKVEPSPGNKGIAPINWSMKKRTLFYRKVAKFNPNLADVSLDNMGTAAYYGMIPWKAVTRYVLIDWNKLDLSLRLNAIDSMVSIINYRILSKRHKAFTQWFFGDPVEASELTGYNDVATSNDETTEFLQRQNNAMAEAMKKRDGLKVVKTLHLKAAEPELSLGMLGPLP